MNKSGTIEHLLRDEKKTNDDMYKQSIEANKRIMYNLKKNLRSQILRNINIRNKDQLTEQITQATQIVNNRQSNLYDIKK